jgi:hypothetical protein
MIENPFLLLGVSDEEWPDGADPLQAAIESFDPENPSPLTTLLASKDPIISQRGLYVFGSLGRKGAVVLDSAIQLVGHPNKMARNALMDGVISCSKRLTVCQAKAILLLANDPFSLVREKVIVFLSNTDLGILEEAVRELDEPLRDEHRSGLEMFADERRDSQQLFDQAVGRRDIWSAYAFASLERRARAGQMEVAPRFEGEDEVASAVVAHIEMLIARRRRTPRH